MFKNLKEEPKLGDFEMEGEIMWVSENRMTKKVIKSKLKKKWHLKINKHLIIMLWVSGDPTLNLTNTLHSKKPHKWAWHQIFTLHLNALDIWVISLYMLFNIYYWIQCRTLNQTWHINIFIWDSQHMWSTTRNYFCFPHKVEPAMIVSLDHTEEPKMVWIDLLNTKRPYKWNDTTSSLNLLNLTKF